MDHLGIRMHLADLYESLSNTFHDDLKTLFENETFIAGGCFKSLALDETVNDYDFFFRSPMAAEKFKELLKTKYKTKSTSLTEHKILDLTARSFVTDNAVTLTFPNNKRIQFVTMYSGSPEDVINNFDFEHAQCYFDPKSGDMIYPDHKIRTKELRFRKNTLAPLSSMKRLIKFVSQGWKIDDANLTKMLASLAGVDWKDKPAVTKAISGNYVRGATMAVGRPGQTIRLQNIDAGWHDAPVDPQPTLRNNWFNATMNIDEAMGNYTRINPAGVTPTIGTLT